MAVPRAWGGSVVTTSASKRIVPPSTARNPASARSSVVLPQPEGPRIAVSLPASKSTETARNASTRP
jgi:hypothetical protein